MGNSIACSYLQKSPAGGQGQEDALEVRSHLRLLEAKQAGRGILCSAKRKAAA